MTNAEREFLTDLMRRTGGTAQLGTLVGVLDSYRAHVIAREDSKAVAARQEFLRLAVALAEAIRQAEPKVPGLAEAYELARAEFPASRPARGRAV